MQLTLDGTRFRFDGRLTYDDNPAGDERVHGLLMNARFIQGVFDDASGRERYARFGFDRYDPDAQTDRLIAALPQWHAAGLRAFTVGFQGGGPCFTIDLPTIDNNPFGPRGDALDDAHAARMDRLIRAADAEGLAVIVSYFYGAQARRFDDDDAVRRAVTTASRWLRDAGYGNVVIEIANEHNVGGFRDYPIIDEPYGVASLIDLARRESGGMPVGCSGTGGWVRRPIVDASDIAFIHGNGQTRQRYHQMVETVRGWAPGKPIVCNEDSPAISNLDVSVRAGVGWGYYNNFSKQEPPTRWDILPGHDAFFAWRMAHALGYRPEPIPEDDRFLLYGLGEHEHTDGRRWPGLACLYPEHVDRVVFERDGEPVETAYADPFAIGWRSNWRHAGCAIEPGRHHWKATATLRDGRTLVREAEADEA